MGRRKIVLGKTSENGVAVARNKVTGGNFVRPTLQMIDDQEIPYFKPHEGENCVRILPPTEDQNFWATQTFIHYSVGVDNSGYLCRKKMQIDEGTCPICEERAIVASEQDPVDKEEAKVLKDLLYELKAKERWILQIIDRDEEAKGVQIWNAPVSLVNEILKQTKIPSRMGGGTKPIDDVKLGSDILFHKGKDKGGFVEYTGVRVLDNNSEITNKDISEMFYIEDLFVMPSYDEVATAFGSKTKSDSNKKEVDIDYGVKNNAESTDVVESEEDVDVEGVKVATERNNAISNRVREKISNRAESNVSIDTTEELPVVKRSRRRRV